MKTEEKKEFKLIDSTFTPNEANNVLSDLIKSKISYHKLDDFSQHIRFERDSQHSKNRIEQLQATQEELKEFINIAKAKGVNLVIKSNVFIEYTE
ncbi:hypothetical protein [Flavobacterium sp.]|jgi:hypothetical protein|uniref:hypothetical protein n=1 Tax=Flavobacterium sp. TaxID=239 RepID=UPI000ED193AD|nr:hypothetical protein [Flavobacterium sp.]HCQ12546.1 hypothetical protein [Flavobacterium sp.]